LFFGLGVLPKWLSIILLQAFSYDVVDILCFRFVKSLEKSTIDRGFSIKTLKIGEQGVFKLLKDINPSKAMGPDQIPNIVLKTCAKTLAGR
jgi:hypothetical protein